VNRLLEEYYNHVPDGGLKSAAFSRLVNCAAHTEKAEASRILLNTGKARTEGEAEKVRKALRFARSISRPVKLSLVMPMYKEETRLMPKSDENDLGENALREKVEQLEMLRMVNENVRWQLVAVDDGSPGLSSKACVGKLWEEIIREYEGRGITLDPSQVITESISPEEKKIIGSEKGGAVIHGLKKALLSPPSGT